MKITKIETFNNKFLCFVKVTTEDGLYGIGQTGHYQGDIMADILHRQLAGAVLGMDSDNIDAVSDRCIESTYKFYGSHICRAASGIDTALWDLKGRREGKSVSQLLGSSEQEIEVYGSSMDKTLQPEQEAERMKRLRQTKGFKAFKLHIAATCGRDGDVWPGRTEAVVPLVKKAIGDCGLYVDPNGAYTVPKALEMAHFFHENGVDFFEEPCPFWHLDETEEVSRKAPLPIAGGEQDFCLEQWKRITDKKIYAINQPDITYVGGFTRALRVAKMAEKAGLFCTPHCGSSSLVTIYSIHFHAVIPNRFPYMELSIDQDHLDPFTKGLYTPVAEVRDGKVKVPQSPGWGAEISPEWFEKARYVKSEL